MSCKYLLTTMQTTLNLWRQRNICAVVQMNFFLLFLFFCGEEALWPRTLFSNNEMIFFRCPLCTLSFLCMLFGRLFDTHDKSYIRNQLWETAVREFFQQENKLLILYWPVYDRCWSWTFWAPTRSQRSNEYHNIHLLPPILNHSPSLILSFIHSFLHVNQSLLNTSFSLLSREYLLSSDEICLQFII